MGGLFFLTDFSDWGYKTSVTITGSTDGTLTNYPVQVTVAYQSFMNTDFSDVRFTLSDGTELNYSLDSYTAGNTANFTVLIPSLPGSPGTVTILVYAGNSTVTTTSNPFAVYNSFDDFEDGKYTNRSTQYKNWTVNGGTPSLVNSGQLSGNYSLKYLSTEGSALDSMIFSDSLTYYTTEFDFKLDTLGTIANSPEVHFFYLRYANSNNYLVFDTFYDASANKQHFRLLKRENGTYTEIYNNTNYSRMAVEDQHHFKVKDTGSHCTVWMDGTQIIDTTYSTNITIGNKGIGVYDNTGGIWDNIKVLQATPNPPTTGTIREWTENSLIISTPPAEGTLKATAPQIVLGGAMTITIPPAGGILTANPPTLHAIISSPSAQGTLTAIPPIIAFLMEVKAGVTYNPDAIEDLQRDGLPVKISFNLTVGGEKYE